eukprot:2930234-Alexandrium_andersonii.AAC.1
MPGQEAHRAAHATATSKAIAASHSLVLSIRPADDAGRPFGSTVRYVSADSVPCESWVKQDAGLVAYQHTHPASRSTLVGQWLAGGNRSDQPAGGRFQSMGACNIASVPAGH